ncbi:hypothetical protein [Acinetobacter baumannii]|uniref:hypothetical protein n=1 Tax=Acinetobacter baumannii TaxID=470 RepID=UPI000671C803|nr:hypothetical protein [Acinetobacter baumannii]CRX64683.1 hypothetical protein ABR2090_1764 [Acinetobacter baumannii]
MKKIIFTTVLGLVISNFTNADTLIPRSVQGDKGKYYLIEKKKQGDIIITLHKRIGVETALLHKPISKGLFHNIIFK